MPQVAPSGGIRLTGPDGTAVSFGDASQTDFAGYIDPDNGWGGLQDSADVRASVDNRVEGHGQVQGNSFLGGKSGTLQGILIAADGSIATYNALEQKLKRASRGLSATQPAVLTWTPDGGSARQMNVYRQGRVVFTGRRPKTFAIALSSPDPYSYSASEHSQIITPAGTGAGGMSFPLKFPLKFVYATAGQQYVVNAGDAESWPTFIITGPITNPTLLNNSTGLSWTLSYTLAAAETLTIDAKARTVVFGASTNRYSAYAANFGSNSWWSLAAGTNDVRLLSAAFSTGAQVEVRWRDAFE